MKLTYIELVFENCESIKIEGKYIGDFLVDNLTTSIKCIWHIQTAEFAEQNGRYAPQSGRYKTHLRPPEGAKCIKRIACNSIEKMDVANTVAIEIHKDANKERYPFGRSNIEYFKEMTFDRLKSYEDITSIQFELEENYVKEGQSPRREYYDYYVSWTGDNEYVNEAQKTYLSKSGNLYVVIADKKNIEDFFCLEDIEDEEYVDFHFDMLDVGDEYGNPDR